MPYSLLADLVLITHSLFVVFIAGGMVLISLGSGLRWRWVRNFWFRITHLGAVIVVVLQSWFAVYCPLTNLEMYFRQQAGQASYNMSFIAYWLHAVLYYEAPFWVFTVVYTLFALVVLLAWVFLPPYIPGCIKTPMRKSSQS